MCIQLFSYCYLLIAEFTYLGTLKVLFFNNMYKSDEEKAVMAQRLEREACNLQVLGFNPVKVIGDDRKGIRHNCCCKDYGMQ